jgi:hypothetical protein
MRKLLLLAGTAALVACGQSGENTATNQTAAASKPVEKPPYCFFKDSETKGWTASREANGSIRIKGKAFRLDARYKAVIGKVAVGPAKVIVWPTIEQNDTGYGAPDNWWDVETVVPSSAALDTAEVHCGDKTIAVLKVPPKG